MASVLGLARLKNNSQKIIACQIEGDYIPIIGTACSYVDGTIEPTVKAFDGEFYGIVCEYFTRPTRHCTIVVAGESVSVLNALNVTINPILETYFELSSGLLTDTSGVAVTAIIQSINETVIVPKTGERLIQQGTVISFNNARTITNPIIPPDFNRPDFNSADFA